MTITRKAAYMRQSRAADPEATRAKERAYYLRNAERLRARKAELMRQYRAADPDKNRSQSRAAKQRLRETLFRMYGQTCSLFGFSDKRALTLDHIRKDGAAERRTLGERGVYRKAASVLNRIRYRILCMNCQFLSRAE